LRIIDEEGKQIGIFITREALRIAGEKGLDLILISPQADPPVAKIADWGKFKYEKTKEEKELRKSQKAQALKEIKLTPKIGEHDLNVRINRIREFLEKKYKIKVTVRFRGRDVVHKELGFEVLKRLVDGVAETGVPDAPPKFEGKQLAQIIVPKKDA
jgi:translation initiation factor IF-3